MTLITRITRLFKADLHGILDDLEEPEEVVKQAIRDMEEDIAREELLLDDLHAVLRRLATEAQEIAEGMQGLERQLDLCFTAGNEPLARNLIRKRLEMAQRAKGVARAQAETHAQRDHLAQKIAAHKQQLAAVVQQLKLWTDNRPCRPWMASGSPLFQGGGVITEDEVEVAFLEEKQRRNTNATSNLA